MNPRILRAATGSREVQLPSVDPASTANGSTWERVLILVAAATVMAALVAFDLGPSARWSQLVDSGWSGWRALAWPGLLMAAIVFVSMFWKAALWLVYRPLPALSPDDPRLLEVTVVIPTFNEGATVYSSIRSILDSDYPIEKLRIIAVDDGSSDDTFAHMTAAQVLDPARVTLIRLERNAGKRAALYAGFQQVTTPVLVTVDSDTVLPADSLRAIVTPIVLRPCVGAVAGRIDVLNRGHNLLTRMLGVRYRVGFDFIRAYQSVLGTVFVCPGAFTAYRMDVIRGELDGWRHQTFLGAPCTNGDDHALTNAVLRQGREARYQSNAVARTNVPTTYKRLSMMYLRWARSNVRESTCYLGFVPRLWGNLRWWPAIIDAVASWVQIPMRIYLLALGWGILFLHPSLLARSVGFALAMSIVHAAIYLRSERSLDASYTVLYSVFSLLTLQWIYPVALITVRHSRWLTR